jgi:ABC-type amino acid transport substrate-binding protein
MDDDASIAEESKDKFFNESIRIMEDDNTIASLSMRIYDENFGESRSPARRGQGVDLFDIYKYYGGSRFLMKECFT